MLVTRVLAALLFAPLLLWVVWVGGLALTITTLALGVVMQWEFYTLVFGRRAALLKGVGILGGLALGLGVLGLLPQAPLSVALPVVVLAFFFVVLARPDPISASAAKVGLLLLGALYAGVLLQYLSLLRGHESGLALALMALFCTFGADTGAYFVGRRFGRHKLYPKISPAKTIEGAVGAVIAAVLVAFLVRALPDLLPASTHQALKLDLDGFGPRLEVGVTAGIGLVAAAFGMSGDLAESMLKRAVGRKDASNLIPGHGGVLDRFDGVLFVAAALYVFTITCL